MRVTALLGPFNAVLPRLLPRYATTTVDLGRAMIHLAIHGDPEHILHTGDINRIAAAAGQR